MLLNRSPAALRFLSSSTRSIAVRSTKRNGLRKYSDDHSAGHHNPPAAPADEALPMWLFYGVGGIFSLWIFTKFVHPSDENFISRMLVENQSKRQQELDRNARHTALVEQAARDKSLFYDTPGSKTVPLKYQERFNVHSPLNNVAGWSTGRSMSQLREFYEKENDKEEAELQEKIKKRNEGKEEQKEYIASIKAT